MSSNPGIRFYTNIFHITLLLNVVLFAWKTENEIKKAEDGPFLQSGRITYQFFEEITRVRVWRMPGSWSRAGKRLQIRWGSSGKKQPTVLWNKLTLFESQSNALSRSTGTPLLIEPMNVLLHAASCTPFQPLCWVKLRPLETCNFGRNEATAKWFTFYADI